MMTAKPGAEFVTPFVSMTAGVSYKGSGEPDATVKPRLAFQVYSSQWKQLQSDRQVRIMFEGADVLSLGEATYDAKVKPTGSSTTSETLTVEIKVEDLARMAKASAVMVQIGRMEFQIKDKHLKTLQPLLDVLLVSSQK
jgi:hypothetical protein